MTSKPAFQILTFREDFRRPQIRQYKKRRSSRKTKSGCLACKAKRVKCDECRPVCDRCRRNGRLCYYSPESGLFQPGTNCSFVEMQTYPNPRTTTFSPSLHLDHPKNGTSTINLMHHFHTHWSDIFHIPFNQDILSISKTSPLVGTTILTIAACHLRHLSPSVRQHRIAEHFQQSQALREFQKVLDTPREELGQFGVDCLIITAMLLSMISFALPESEITSQIEPETSWVFSTRDDRLGWLALQVGLRPLLLSIRPYIETTMNFLVPIFFGGSENQWEFQRMHHGLEGIPQQWIDFFELDGTGSGCDPNATSTSEIFRGPITILSQLRNLEPVSSNIFKSLQFLAKVQQEFRALLFKRDERALWLFGYWLGTLCRYEGAWWCENRARRDYVAICMWLRQSRLTELSGIEGTMWINMMNELEVASVWPNSSNETVAGGA